MAILFRLFQFQFQFFTFNLKNSDKTKSRGFDCQCDRGNLGFARNVFFSESLLHEPPSSDLSIIGGGTEDRRISWTETLFNGAIPKVNSWYLDVSPS